MMGPASTIALGAFEIIAPMVAGVAWTLGNNRLVVRTFLVMALVETISALRFLADGKTHLAATSVVLAFIAMCSAVCMRDTKPRGKSE